MTSQDMTWAFLLFQGVFPQVVLVFVLSSFPLDGALVSLGGANDG